MAFSSEQQAFLRLVPTGRSIGNIRLLRKLGWNPARYQKVRGELLHQGVIALGRGRGGSVRRIDNLDDLAQQLMAEVPSDGSPIGNERLRRRLGWNEQQYWDTRNQLLEQGLILRGRGRGGAIFRATPETALEVGLVVADDIDGDDEAADSGWHVPHTSSGPPEPPQGPRTYDYEKDMYPDLRAGLDTWAREHRLKDNLFRVRDTADQGSKKTGKWSRPDAVVIGIKHFPLINQNALEVITFEAKLSSNLDIRGIHEASAHRRFSTHSYAFFQVTEEQYEDEERRELMKEEAFRVGVGLIFATAVHDFDTWDELVKARAHQPEWELLENFVGDQLGGREVIGALWGQLESKAT